VCDSNYVIDTRLREGKKWRVCWFYSRAVLPWILTPLHVQEWGKVIKYENIFLNATHKKGGGWVKSSFGSFFA
jgi:hypothetical protein